MEFEIEGIKYELEKLLDINYTIQKMSDYLNLVGIQKAIRSQKFIRHLHLHIGLKLNMEINIPKENILFEVEMHNKKVDLLVKENDEPKIVITIRSQISSIKKNFTNNVNSLQGEVVSLKSFYPDLKVCLVYLLKQKDFTTNDDCSNYYLQNIPKKLLPLINTSRPSTNCFDAALIIIWDINEEGKIIVDDSNCFTQIYNEENFFNDLKAMIQSEKILAQFSLDDIDINKLKEFLGI